MKIFWIENLRAIACMMVVLLHTSAIYVLKTDGLYWEIGNFFDSFTRVCVPIFFMISGYLLFNDKKMNSNNLKKLIYPLFFYSFIAWVFVFLSYKYGYVDVLSLDILSKPAFYHLWYFYPLITIYIISNFVQIRNVKFTKKEIFYFFLFVFVFLNPAINDYLNVNYKFNNYFFINSEFLFYLIYAFMGGMLANISISNSLNYIYLLIFIFASFIIFLLNSFTGTTIYYNYCGPLVSVGAICLFIYFKSNLGFLSKEIKILKFISKYSLGVYGIHAFILLFIEKIFIIKGINPLLGIPLFFVMVLILSLMFCVILSRIIKKPQLV